MLNRPSSRRKSEKSQISLNLVPILDTMVTLIGFLLFSMSFLNLVSVETPFPQMSEKEVEQKNKEKPLQLTVSFNAAEIEVWSPFDRVPPVKIAYLPDGNPDTKKLHETLIQIKEKFPTENQIVLVPSAEVSYENLILAMDAVRLIEKTDPPLFKKNLSTGIDEPVKALFPEVVFGNLLGDT